MKGFADVVQSFAELSVVVIGDALLDVYMHGAAERLCREGPVPVVRLRSRVALPGGAGNTAVNAAAMGAAVRLVSVVGRGPDGELLHSMLDHTGVPTNSLVPCDDRPTPSLYRLLAGSQLVARYDNARSDNIGRDVEDAVIDELEAALEAADAVVVSDYGYGVVTPRVVEVLADHHARCPHVLVVDSKTPARFQHLGATAVEPNWAEAVRILGAGELDGVNERADGIAAQGDRLLELTGAQIAAVTLDSEGAIAFERDHPPHRIYTPERRYSEATGAGDTFVSAFTLALAAGAHTPAAAEVASAAAAVVVGKEHTAAMTQRR